jgi:hypothetical protein
MSSKLSAATLIVLIHVSLTAPAADTFPRCPSTRRYALEVEMNYLRGVDIAQVEPKAVANRREHVDHQRTWTRSVEHGSNGLWHVVSTSHDKLVVRVRDTLKNSEIDTVRTTLERPKHPFECGAVAPALRDRHGGLEVSASTEPPVVVI